MMKRHFTISISCTAKKNDKRKFSYRLRFFGEYPDIAPGYAYRRFNTIAAARSLAYYIKDLTESSGYYENVTILEP